MMSHRILAIEVFISSSLLCLGLVLANNATGPSNLAVIVGQRMTMECHGCNGSSILKWMFTRPNSEKKEQLFRQLAGKNILGQNFSHFGFDVDSHGSGFIYTNSTRLSDAGLYFCYIQAEKQTQLNAHLIVFDEPICETNYTAEGDTDDNETSPIYRKSVWLRCRANFRGLWSPTVEWTQGCAQGANEESKQLPIKEANTKIIYNENLTSTLIVYGDPGQTICFNFKIFFLWQNDTVPVTATNLPNFTYTWKSPFMSFPVKTKVVEAPRLPAQVVSQPEGGSNWYVMAIGLLVALVTIGSLIVFIVGRSFCVRCNRVRGFERSNEEACPSHLQALGRPASGIYDVIPNALPNVYDKIYDCDGKADFDENDNSKNDAPQTKVSHPPVTRCYSTLSDASIRTMEPYDALSPYLPMRSPVGTLKSGELFNPGKIGNNLVEDRNQTNALVSAFRDGKDRSVNDYLAVDNDDTAVDVSDYVYPEVDEKQQAFVKQSDDYLVPIA